MVWYNSLEFERFSRQEVLHHSDKYCLVLMVLYVLEYDKYVATTTTDTDITNHVMKGYSRLLDPQAVSLLFTSLRSIGHPNILPSVTSTVAFDARSADGTAPDNRLTIKSSEDNGGLYTSDRVPDSLFDDKSTLVKLWICIDKEISPILNMN